VRVLDRFQPIGLLVLRLVLGAIMVAHGSQKVFGGMHVHMQRMAALGMPSWLAYVSATAEFLGGILVLLGLFTRCAALAILINMSVAISKVHWKNGFIKPGGVEFPLALAAIALALIFFGSGPIGLDRLLGRGSSRGSRSPRAR
jgi:putative oxidoreductase